MKGPCESNNVRLFLKLLSKLKRQLCKAPYAAVTISMSLPLFIRSIWSDYLVVEAAWNCWFRHVPAFRWSPNQVTLASLQTQPNAEVYNFIILYVYKESNFKWYQNKYWTSLNFELESTATSGSFASSNHIHTQGRGDLIVRCLFSETTPMRSVNWLLGHQRCVWA